MTQIVIPALLLAGLFGATASAADAKLAVVAAENFYGDIARQIGGDRVEVVNIIENPDQDPHLFETTPSVARALADARVVIFNGAEYDPWMPALLAAQPTTGRSAIVVADLIGKKAGDNPHLWYDPAAAPALAGAVATEFAAADPEGTAGYAKRRDAFLAAWTAIRDRIAAIREKADGAPVTASESVFGYMAEALGLTMRNERFQLSIMNDTEPSARDLAAMEDDLRTGKVKAFVYNLQVTDPLTDRLLGIARDAGVPVVGVTETLPAGLSFQDWMRRQIDDLGEALGEPSS